MGAAAIRGVVTLVGAWGMLVGAAIVSGCAPGLGNSLEVNKISDPLSASTSALDGVRVRVEPFLDARATSPVGQINGRPLAPAGEPGVEVQRGFERALKQRGARLALFDTPVRIAGQINDWSVVVSPRFPASSVEAHATIKVELLDPQGALVFKGEYSGTSSVEHPLANQRRVEAVLGDAMGQAISQALADSELMSRIGGRAVR